MLNERKRAIRFSQNLQPNKSRELAILRHPAGGRASVMDAKAQRLKDAKVIVPHLRAPFHGCPFGWPVEPFVQA